MERLIENQEFELRWKEGCARFDGRNLFGEMCLTKKGISRQILHASVSLVYSVSCEGAIAQLSRALHRAPRMSMTRVWVWRVFCA